MLTKVFKIEIRAISVRLKGKKIKIKKTATFWLSFLFHCKYALLYAL